VNDQAEPFPLLAVGLFGLPSLFLVGWLVHAVRKRGGRVRTQMLGLPDLLMAFFLSSFFGYGVLLAGKVSRASAAGGEGAGGPSISVDQMGGNVNFFLGLVAVILGMLWYRRIPIAQFFGVRSVHPFYAILSGASIIFAVFPLFLVMGQLVQQLLQEAAHEQDVVTMFRKVVEKGDKDTLSLLFLMAIVFQPIVEEVIFRGYIYPTFKGWSGMVASALATSLLFAAVHMTATALPLLFVLALLLTLAYEWSGSILVPITMHMAFNGAQLLILKWGMENAPT
jgi:membrane protease YdiL (CAAX protease family)